MNIKFFISFDYFKFKDIKKDDLKNFEEHFVFKITFDFNKLLSQYNNINSFHFNLVGNNNRFLFYIGVEQKINDKILQYEKIIIDYFDLVFGCSNVIDREINCVKIKIGKQNNKQKYSLACLLLVINYKNSNYDLVESENTKFYVLFPIRCGDFHK